MSASKKQPCRNLPSHFDLIFLVHDPTYYPVLHVYEHEITELEAHKLRKL